MTYHMIMASWHDDHANLGARGCRIPTVGGSLLVGDVL